MEFNLSHYRRGKCGTVRKDLPEEIKLLGRFAGI
jgi:hypothetical protein